MLTVGLAILGLAIGPFLGVIIDRAVNRERLKPTHRCAVIKGESEVDPDELPELCGGDLGPRSLVPVLSWFQKCPVDSGHRHWRYPLTDMSAAAAFAAAGYRFGSDPWLVPYLVLFAVLVAASIIDLETRLLVDVLTKPAFLAFAFAVLVLSPGLGIADNIWPAFAAGAFYFGVFGLLHLISPASLGRGDVKLAPTLGMAVGWVSADIIIAIRLTMYSIVVASLLSFIVGATAGLILMNDWRKYPVPMGPFLAIGAVAMISVSSLLNA